MEWPTQVAAVTDPSVQRLDTPHFKAEVQRSFRGNRLRAHVMLQPLVDELPAAELPKGNGDPSAAKIRDHVLWMDGREQAAVIYDRSRLKQGDVIPGPAIVTEMDSTTLIEAGCVATVDAVGNILINPAKEG